VLTGFYDDDYQFSAGPAPVAPDHCYDMAQLDNINIARYNAQARAFSLRVTNVDDQMRQRLPEILDSDLKVVKSISLPSWLGALPKIQIPLFPSDIRRRLRRRSGVSCCRPSSGTSR